MPLIPHAPDRSVARETVNHLLASVFWQGNDGLIHSFGYGKPGSAYWQQHLGVEIQYKANLLTQAALFVRKEGPRHLRHLPLADVRSLLMNFVADFFWYIGEEVFGATFECSFGDFLSERAKRQLVEAIERSDVFNPKWSLHLFPIDIIRIKDGFQSPTFFLESPDRIAGLLPDSLPRGELDPLVYPPWREDRTPKRIVSAWLGINATGDHESEKIKAAVLGALALTPHRLERYLFTMRKVYGGKCHIAESTIAICKRDAHTPSLSEDIEVSASDHAWLTRLSTKLTSDTNADLKHIKALEYYYRAWMQGPVPRFATLFMALDAIFGDVGAATQSVIDAISPLMGPEYTFERLKRLMSLRAAVVHGGAPEVCESDNYHRYYADYSEDPISALELIAARCFQAVIFQGDLKERPHTHADLIYRTTGVLA